jgi:hypothetical protein
VQVEASRMGSALAAGSQASKPPRVLVMSELRNLEMGMWEGQSMRMVSNMLCNSEMTCYDKSSLNMPLLYVLGVHEPRNLDISVWQGNSMHMVSLL